MAEPDVSIVIPTHNRVRRLESTLNLCLGEGDGFNIEVIVVNDGSSDGTREYLDQVDDRRVRTIHQSAQGAQVARNKGMTAAKGEYIKFLDDDDRLAPEALGHELNMLRQSSACVSYGAVQIELMDGSTYVRIPSEEGDLVTGLMRNQVAAHPHAFLYHRDALKGIRWNENLSYYQDTDFIFRVSSRGVSSVRIPETVALHYQHDDGRISDRKQDAPVVEQQRRRVETVLRSLRTLEEHDALRPMHRTAAAEGIWRWAYMAAPYDFAFFQEAAEKANDIDPEFTPPRDRALLSWFDRLVGPVATEALINPLRRSKQFFYGR